MAAIHSAGGLAVMAHPGLYRQREGWPAGEEVECLLRDGFDGVEIHHYCHEPEEVVALQALAHRLGLAVTGGYYSNFFDGKSDYLGFESTRAAAAKAYEQAGITNPREQLDVLESAGRPVMGLKVKIVDEAGEELPHDGEAFGELLIRGPWIAAEYFKDERSSQSFVEGWLRTGDVCKITPDGYIRITDRLSRFSKIGGEMVPHGAIEEALAKAYGEAGAFSVTAVPDERKGERIAVPHTIDEAKIPGLLDQLKADGLPNLFIPRADSFVKVDAIPVLGTGKTDLRAVKQAATEALS